MGNTHRSPSRHPLTITGGVLVLLLAVAACGSPGEDEDAGPVAGEEGDGAGGSADPDAINIGLLAPTTGNVAASGEDMVRGWNLYWEQNGTEVAGREVATVEADDAGDPDIGLSEARRLVEQEDVDMLVGPLLANVGLAVADYASREGVPSFQPVVSADNLTQRERLPGVLRIGGWTSSQTGHPAGQWAYDEGHRTAVTLCADYAYGHEYCGGFANTFTDAGGEIVDQLWNPQGTGDFAPYIAQIQDADPDVVFVVEVGGDSVQFVESWADFGVDVPLIGGETLTDQSLLRGMDPAAAEGIVTVGKFAEGRDSSAMQEFVEAYDEAYGDLPSYYAANCYIGAQWLAEAIEAVDGNVEETEAFLEAVQAVELDTLNGQMSMDEYGNPVLNAYVREVEERDDGRMWNVPTETFEDVSQFWTYDAEEFLAEPVYSRDYQGIDP